MGDTTQKTLEEFLKLADEEEEKIRTPEAEFVERSDLKIEFDKKELGGSTPLFQNYIVETYKHGIKGEYGESTVVNMTAPDGEKVRLWLNGAALQQFKRRVASWEEKTEEHPNGIQFPINISFRMEKAQSQKDESRVYNKLKIVTVGTGEDVKRELETL